MREILHLICQLYLIAVGMYMYVGMICIEQLVYVLSACLSVCLDECSEMWVVHNCG